MPLVSIIVPAYNLGCYLEECLNSVYNQSFKDWECIIINDCSTDDTEDVALSWCQKDNRFVYLKNQKNRGLSRARNEGLKIVKGDFIHFLDSDDLLEVNKLEEQLRVFSEGVDIVITDYFPFSDSTGEYESMRYASPFPDIINYRYDLVSFWEKSLSIPVHTVLFRKELLVSSNLIFDESMPNHEDWVFWVKLFYKSRAIYHLKMPLARYRIRSNSMCSDEKMMAVGFRMACLKNREFFRVCNDPTGIRLCQERLDEFYLDHPPFSQIIFTKAKGRAKGLIGWLRQLFR